MTGMDRFSDKDRRKQRRRNKYAKELEEIKYRPRVKESKKGWSQDELDDLDEWLDLR